MVEISKEREECMRIKVKGVPISKHRPRFARFGKGVRTYDDQHTEAGLWFLQAQPQIIHKYLGPIILHCEFVFPRPKSHFGSGKNSGKLKNSAPDTHTKKPDVSNLIKFPEDILNGSAWHDDSQIIEVVAKKRFCSNGEEPHTELIVVSIAGEGGGLK